MPDYAHIQVRPKAAREFDLLEERISKAMGQRVYRADIAAAAFRLLKAELDGPEPDAVIWRAVTGEGER
jgi:hypothetical protein